eukprot:2695314-Lingulodinium_polyedra.AAC.1
MLIRVIHEMVPTDYPQWLECVAATQEAKNNTVPNNGWSPFQVLFGRNPEIPAELTSEDPDPIANSA